MKTVVYGIKLILTITVVLLLAMGLNLIVPNRAEAQTNGSLIFAEPEVKVKIKPNDVNYPLEAPFDKYSRKRHQTIMADRYLEQKLAIQLPSCMVLWHVDGNEPVIVDDEKYIEYVAWATARGQKQEWQVGCDDLPDFFVNYSEETFVNTIFNVDIGDANSGPFWKIWEFVRNPFAPIRDGLGGQPDKERLRQVYRAYDKAFRKYNIYKIFKYDNYWTRTAPACSLLSDGRVKSNIGIDNRNIICSEEWQQTFRASSIYRLSSMVADMPPVAGGGDYQSVVDNMVLAYRKSGMSDFPSLKIGDLEQYVSSEDIDQLVKEKKAKIVLKTIGGVAVKVIEYIDHNAAQRSAELWCSVVWPGYAGCANRVGLLWLRMTQPYKPEKERFTSRYPVKVPDVKADPLPNVIVNVPPVQLPPELVKTNNEIVAVLRSINAGIGGLKGQNYQQLDMIRRSIDSLRGMNANPGGGDISPLLAEIRALKEVQANLSKEVQTTIRGENRALGDLLTQLVNEIQVIQRAQIDRHNQMADLAGIANERLLAISESMARTCSMCRPSLEEYTADFRALDLANRLRVERPNTYKAIDVFGRVSRYGQSGQPGNGAPICLKPMNIEQPICYEVQAEHKGIIRSVIGLSSVCGAVVYVLAALRGNRE